MQHIDEKVTFFREEPYFPSIFPPVPMQTVLTIAGFDPSSGAGITADLMVFAAHGLFGTSCITAITVQSTLGVASTHPVANEIVANTLDCLQADLPPVGIKIGMLGSTSNTSRICDYLEKYNPPVDILVAPKVLIVLDPIFHASSGHRLLDEAGTGILRDRLLPLVDWLTPNLDELSALSGVPVKSREDVPDACHTLQDQVASGRNGGRIGVLATGGHMDPPDDLLLQPTGEEIWIPGERIVTRATHGTGCAFSSAFLSRLVLGDTPHQAAVAAKAYVTGALRTAPALGAGHGPMNHLWQLRQDSTAR